MEELETRYLNDSYIYFHKEVLIHSKEDRAMDVITLSSRKYMKKELEPRFDKLLFPVIEKARAR